MFLLPSAPFATHATDLSYRACVRACVSACVRACVRACVCGREREGRGGECGGAPFLCDRRSTAVPTYRDDTRIGTSCIGFMKKIVMEEIERLVCMRACMRLRPVYFSVLTCVRVSQTGLSPVCRLVLVGKL